jgi:hypothetical protein
MKIERILTSLVVAAVAVFVLAQAAEAHTCSSACNQIRRACVSNTKAVKKIGKIKCDDNPNWVCAADCATDCAANEGTCNQSCNAARAVCDAACAGDSTCLADCEATETSCLGACDVATCTSTCQAACDDDRATCLAKVKEDVTESKVLCDAARTGCNDTCVDPIDSNCVNACKSAQRSCRSSNKRDEGTCKKACAKGAGKKACIRGCQQAFNESMKLCGNEELACIAGQPDDPETPANDPEAGCLGLYE